MAEILHYSQFTRRELIDKFLAQFRESITKIQIEYEDNEELCNKVGDDNKVVGKVVVDIGDDIGDDVGVSSSDDDLVVKVGDDVVVADDVGIEVGNDNFKDFEAYELPIGLYKQVREGLEISDEILFCFLEESLR
jgi:hypothetical protein